MKIKRDLMAEPINAKTTSNPLPKYCPVCEKHGVSKNKLNKRIYKETELVFGMLPHDHDDWLQCYHCGNIFLDDRVRQEGKLRTDLEIAKPSPRETEHWEKPKHRRGFNERLTDQNKDEIKDPEVKKALKKGQKLLSYQEL